MSEDEDFGFTTEDNPGLEKETPSEPEEEGEGDLEAENSEEEQAEGGASEEDASGPSDGSEEEDEEEEEKEPENLKDGYNQEIFKKRKGKLIKEGNLMRKAKINYMYDENLIYQETMDMLLEDLHIGMMYEKYDYTVAPPVNKGDIKFELQDSAPGKMEYKEVRHILTEPPNSGPHIHRSLEHKLNGQEIEDQIKFTLFREGQFQNTILNHSHQLSLWKIDHFGAVKIKERYFTPDLLSNMQGEFKMTLSADRTALIVEEEGERDKKLVLVFDPNNLFKAQELEVSFVDYKLAHVLGKNVPYLTDESHLNTPQHSDYSTSENIPVVSALPRGEQLLISIRQAQQGIFVYKFRLLDSETGKPLEKDDGTLMEDIPRTGHLTGKILYLVPDIKSDEEFLILVQQ